MFLERLTGQEGPLPSVRTCTDARAGRAAYTHRRDRGPSWPAPPHHPHPPTPARRVNWEMASLPPDAASEGDSQGLGGAGFCTATGAKEEQLINLILKQIYKIVNGFAGSRRKWFPGERGAGGGQGRKEAPPLPCTQHLRAGPLTFSVPSLPTSSPEAEPADPSGGIDHVGQEEESF